jgi:hypothetical protein
MLVDRLDLDFSQPVNIVTAEDVKRVTGSEPRLVMYVDQRRNLPRILAQNGVFPLAVRNGVYALVKGDGFHDLEPIRDERSYESNLDFSLSTLQQGIGEDRYLMYALHSGAISDFTENESWFPTSVGRKRANHFRFHVGHSPILDVKGVQFQVDLLLESKRELLVLEAKTNGRETFNIRQLYYPYRHWQEEIPDKPTRTVFFLYNTSSDTYNFWEYTFANDLDYSSIELEKSASYRITGIQRTLEEYLSVPTSSVDSLPENYQVPQADDIDKVQEFPLRVSQGIDNSKKIAEYFGFTLRQSSYYRDAAEGLGLVKLKEDNSYELTELGESYVSLPIEKRNDVFAKCLLRHPIMKEVLLELASEDVPYVDRQGISNIIRNRSNLSGTTPRRRARTILSWFEWLGLTLGIVNVRNNRIRLSSSALNKELDEDELE